MNTTLLLAKAKSGTLSSTEAQEVAGALSANLDSDSDRYTLLHILGKYGSTVYEDIISHFLESPDDPMLARIALQSLCDYLGLTTKYIGELVRFCRGVAWDTSDDVRLVAISTAGEYLRQNNDAELRSCLLETFNNPEERSIIRNTAYSAIARAVGKEWNEIPTPRKLSTGAAIDPMVIDAFARKSSAGECCPSQKLAPRD